MPLLTEDSIDVSKSYDGERRFQVHGSEVEDLGGGSRSVRCVGRGGGRRGLGLGEEG